jgi:eukaryotic-like serine/threonine-protein kinase
MAVEHLGPYRIERLLGRGGMGAVYAGVHEETGEPAAIKVLAESLAIDARFRQRFLGEVETLKRLRHKNIVTLQGYGEQEGTPYFVMDLVDGPSLDDVLRAGRRFTWREVVDIGVQVCAALKHAHDHGIVHRDLKPANLLLAADGTVKLTDFGIAKFFGGTSLTMAGSMIGTPDYMSPEQVEGKPATPRSDLYCLGCVLYALLTGKPPLTGASITAVMDRVRHETPRPVRSVAPQTPQVLDDIVAQLLRKNPEDRIATPQLLANLLQAMTHALSARDAAGASSGDRSEDGGETTVVGDIGEPLAPETAGAAQRKALPPGVTAEDAPHANEEITVPKAIPAGPPADGDVGETVDYSARPRRNTAESAERKTHFTPVSEREWRSVIGTPAETAPAHRERFTIALLAAALLAVIGTAVFLGLPPSADKLYRRIQDRAALPAERDQCSRLTAEFLERFPDDSRAAEIQQLRADLQCRSLQHELGNKVRTLTELEQAYLQGMSLADRGQWTEAAMHFQQIVAGLESRVLSAADRRLLDRAQHMRGKSQQHAQ